MPFPNDDTKFKPGQSGNPNGRPKKLPELEVLLAEVLSDEKDGTEAAKAILMALRAKAVKGDIRAAEVLLDRAYGKAKQSSEVSIKTDQPIFNIDVSGYNRLRKDSQSGGS
jgi:hypothetical protein